MISSSRSGRRRTTSSASRPNGTISTLASECSEKSCSCFRSLVRMLESQRGGESDGEIQGPSQALVLYFPSIQKRQASGPMYCYKDGKLTALEEANQPDGIYVHEKCVVCVFRGATEASRIIPTPSRFDCKPSRKCQLPIARVLCLLPLIEVGFFLGPMAALQPFSCGVVGARSFPLFEGLRLAPTAARTSSCSGTRGMALKRSFSGLVVKAATVIAPKYTSIQPVGDRVLVKIKSSEEQTSGGILLPTTAQTKPQSGEVVAVGEGRTIGKIEIKIGIEAGKQVVYSKYAGTELEFHGSNHLLLKEDDLIGILETDDIKDLKPLNDRVLIKVAEAEEKTAGGLLLTQATKEKPSVGTVIAVGPGNLDPEGNRTPLKLEAGSTVMFSKYAGSEFKSSDGAEFIVLRASDVMASLSS
ncbi:20 kDa chaperonin, chloroplastic-like isoform X2 [Zingiber officinale]|uniref:20 kDa chaperonin, chloroplastic-like isoform X2 n=1 Tax=Zingiber officinale TaxID=94328 RepID=UPI001C4D84A5|nr:20 kDa chaperonin, chloroplastic-like isoform X2 [Zingiber officinale]